VIAEIAAINLFIFFLLFFQETKVVRKNALRRAEGMTKRLFSELWYDQCLVIRAFSSVPTNGRSPDFRTITQFSAFPLYAVAAPSGTWIMLCGHSDEIVQVFHLLPFYLPAPLTR
jgi:hypothetical protein